MTPGRKPSISASAVSTSLRSASRSPGFFKSSVMLFFPPAHHIEVRLQKRGFGPADANDLRAEIGKQHATKRTRTDAFDFDDSKPVEWTHAQSSDSARRKVIDARFS